MSKLEQMAEEYAPLDERSISTAYWQREGFKAGFQAALNLPEVKAMREALKFYKEHADCSETCRSRGDGWLTRCSCGFEEKQNLHRKALADLEGVIGG